MAGEIHEGLPHQAPEHYMDYMLGFIHEVWTVKKQKSLINEQKI